jgi:hypothetical protein
MDETPSCAVPLRSANESVLGEVGETREAELLETEIVSGMHLGTLCARLHVWTDGQSLV